ncbi:MAG: hypothetical protein WBN88_16745 [Anderseniella sp.]
MKKFVIAAACGAFILAGNTGASSAGEMLSAKEIKKFIPGRAKAKIMGSKVTMRMSRGGSLSAKWDGERDTGVWRVAKNQLCIKFKKWMNGATRCSSVSRIGNSYRVAGITFSKY